MVVQAEFQPLEALQHLFVFVKHMVLKPEYATKFTLFMTPPRRVLKPSDAQTTFWDAGMVPGAYVHVSIESDMFKEGLNTEHASQQHIYREFLRSELVAAETDVAPAPQKPDKEEATAAGAEGPQRAGGEFRSTRSTKVASSGKVPKWFKQGK